jgi:protein-S-isoprenylcysteine O-methyltransferase Ste14
MRLPRYWKYFDILAIVGVILAFIGILLIIYGAWIGIVKHRSEIEIYLALIGIALTFVGIIAIIVVSIASLKSMKIELKPKSE